MKNEQKTKWKDKLVQRDVTKSQRLDEDAVCRNWREKGENGKGHARGSLVCARQTSLSLSPYFFHSFLLFVVVVFHHSLSLFLFVM